MNNAQYVATMQTQPKIDRLPYLLSKEKELGETVTAIKTIASSPEWKKLKRNLFDGLHDSLQKKLSEEKDEKEIYRLQGQFVWTSKFCDLDKLSKIIEVELTSIKNQIYHAKTEEN